MYGYGSYGFGGGLPSVVKKLLIANVVVFLVTTLLPYSIWFNLFGLVPGMVLTRFTVWQLFTYMFLHGGFGHIFFNMFGLWMFGAELEYAWGSRDFFKYYVICGIGAGVLVVITSLFGFSSMFAPTIGASGAIWGILVAYGLMWPDRLIFVFGILPMKAILFVIIFGALELLQGLGRSGGGVAYFAHVGGGLTGFVYLKFGWRLMAHLESWWNHYKARREARKHKFTIHEGGAQESKETRRMSDAAYTPRHPEKDEEVNRILDKIAREGMDSLDEREKRILENASKRKKQ
jgi:membrane associated rhomboid family serine protease